MLNLTRTAVAVAVILSTWLASPRMAPAAAAAAAATATYAVDVDATGNLLVRRGDATATFTPDFVVLYAAKDPQLALRPADIDKVSYNVSTWTAAKPQAAGGLKKKAADASVAGDGFDDRIIRSSKDSRTPNLFAAGEVTKFAFDRAEKQGSAWRLSYKPNAVGRLSATVTPAADGSAPSLAFEFTPAKQGFYSVGYVGAPATPFDAAAEIFQPLVWTEKRIPDSSYLTLAFHCTIPTTLVSAGGRSVGVVVDSSEFPFNPLPTDKNSRFGIALRDGEGNARPMVFAPALGGAGSELSPGQSFKLKLRPFVGDRDVPRAFEQVARELYGFADFRRNGTATLNQTLDNMLAYGMSRFSRFREELKGCAYDTDAPGTVKNVSSLNPIDMALVTDDEALFDRRAYPYVEYMLSRERFLFTLDEKQKIQNPSYTLKGPCAPLSELVSLYNMFGGATSAFLDLAKDEYGNTRSRNLEVTERGDKWPNSLALYRATKDPRFLEKAKRGADAYIKQSIDAERTVFGPAGAFFWTAHAPDFTNLYELYETTGDKKYLDAAHTAARRFTLYTWTGPQVPNEDVLVNEGGMAPLYWYLKAKGHKPMPAPEERVPAWRLSEIGLTCESSGTSAGHRAIFMANYAPWLMRIGHETGDAFLQQVARHAVIGRYASFPGYHINTARTTVYEKVDYPLHEHTDLSVNSFHYNHVWPMASMLLDYLVADATARSGGKIHFPSQFIEGYAYLQNKAYGGQVGSFFGHDDAVLWMPRGLITSDNLQLNYLTARGQRKLYVALLNESTDAVETTIHLSPEKLPAVKGKTLAARTWTGNAAGAGPAVQVVNGDATVRVPPRGLTALVIDDLDVQPAFQQKVMGLKPAEAWKTGFAKFGPAAGRAMVLNLGPQAKTVFAYLEDSKHEFNGVTINYTIDGQPGEAKDAAFPWEFTIPLPPDAKQFTFHLTGAKPAGGSVKSDDVTLSR
jgi:hypothetical protein